jgi:acyl-CoA reductase-like NAD-dependent aldehyde dehydrogenase
MKIPRIISIGIVTIVALVIGIASFDPVYAEVPCCSLKDGVRIVTKTGKPASPAQIRTMQTSQSPASTEHLATAPKPAGGAATSGGGGGHTAAAAFLSWSRLGYEKRRPYLERFAEALDKRNSELSRLLTLEQGKPLRQAALEIQTTIDVVRYFANAVLQD